MSTDTAKQLETFKAIREIAAILITVSDKYTQVMGSLEEGDLTEELRAECLSVCLLSAQIQVSSLEALAEIKKSIDKPYHPPMLAIMILGTLTGSLVTIASAQSKVQLEDAALTSLETLHTMVSAPSVDTWLRTCLGDGSADTV